MNLNPHTGSSFDEFLQEEEIEILTKVEREELEELAKKCPRCGAQTAGKAQRCAKHLKQLRENKKKPGHWQRAQTKADDALRRQKGKNGTAHKKSTGLGSRKSIVKQVKSAEKKTGQKLSPDRKQNGKGYAASNTRMVPEKLNRGRHHVDPKKLRAWKKRLKKANIDEEMFFTSLLAKANETGDASLLEMLNNMSEAGVSQYIDIFDDEGLQKSVKVLDKDDVVYFDVNETLLDKNNKPIVKNIEKLKEMKAKGYGIVVWSGSKWKKAKDTVEKLGLTKYVDAILSKPEAYVDDKTADKWMGEHKEA